MQDNLVKLQIQLSFQEDTISQLNEVVTRQQQDITQLTEDVTQLKKLYRALMVDVDAEIKKDERPPHY